MNYTALIKDYIPVNEQEAQDKKVILTYIYAFPETILKRENDFAHFTSSGFILNKTLDKTLMVFHNIYQSWSWTGGHVDGDDDFLQVAIKEAKEETGISNLTILDEQIASIDILPVNGHFKKGNYVSSHLHLSIAYVMIASEEESIEMNLDENSGVEWIAISELSQYCTEPFMIEVYMKLIEKAKVQKRSKDNGNN